MLTENLTLDYTSDAPSLFAQVLTTWMYCPTCFVRTGQEFSHDEEIYEVYVCRICKHEHKIAVR